MLKKLPGLIYCYLFFVTVFLLVSPFPLYCKPARQNILIITSYHHGDFTNDSIVDSLLRDFADEPDVSIYIEHLDKRRFFYNQELDGVFEEYLRTKYRNKNLDLIIISDDDALDLILRTRPDIFSAAIPVVFCGINNFTPERIQGAVNITGVNEQVNIVKTIELALTLFPNTETVFAIVDDQSRLGVTNSGHFDSASRYFNGRLTFKKILNLTGEDAPKTLSEVPPNSLLIRLNNLISRDGGFLPIKKSMNIISQSASVPVLTPWGFDIGEGALCGAVITAAEQARKAGELAKDVLRGTPVDRIPVVMESPTLLMFDYFQMQRFSIPEEMLPADSVIINKPFSVYENYKTVIWAAFSVFFVLLLLVIVLVVAIFRIKEAEKLLHDEKNKLASLLKFQEEMLNTAAIWINTTDNQGNIVLWNNAAEAISGYSVGEVVGHGNIWEWLYPDPDYRSMIDGKVQDILTKGEKVENFETTIRVKNGKTKIISWFSNAIVQNDQVVGSIALGADITQRELALKERKKLSELFYQSQKMDAIGQLAGGVAHDFNNMLAGIMGTAELIRLEEYNPENIKQYIELIINTTHRAGSLAKQLLTFSRKGEKVSRNINILHVIEETVTLLTRTIDKTITVSIENHASRLNITGDDVLLQNCFMNMGINASHAMPDGGNLTYCVKNRVLDGNYCRMSPFDLEPGPYVEISVADTGTGMTEDVSRHIFEPFFTTKSKGEGTGLGLAAVYGIVQDHHGAITVFSEPGGGTVFHMYLPLSDKTGMQPALPGKVGKGCGTILLIDDEEIVRMAVKLQLEKFGYTVFAAENGKAGIDIFEKRKKEISLIIIDMVMPVMGGRETYSIIRKIDEQIPVVIASGFTEEAYIEEMKQSGAGISGFLKKPFLIEELARVIEHVLQA